MSCFPKGFFGHATVFCLIWLSQTSAADEPSTGDWLVDPAPFVATIRFDESTHSLSLDNGVVRRTLRLAPNVATVDLQSLVTGEQLLRAVGPEARVTINGKEFPIGGLQGQPVANYLKTEWIDGLKPIPSSYQFVEWKAEPLAARFPWKKRREWMPRDAAWPPPGKQIVLRFKPPKTDRADVNLPEIDLHYAIYDGIPLIEKWVVVRNTTGKPVRVDRTIVETLHVTEPESAVEPNINWEQSPLYVETDYAFLAMNAKGANKQVVHWLADPDYATQVNYERKTPCLLEVAPEFGPGVDLPPGQELTSLRVFELVRDSDERERRGLAQRRMYRVIAPWVQENPVMVHLVASDPKTIRAEIDQAAAVGVELVILSFGSGLNMESRDADYQTQFKTLADYAASKGIVLGGYSLLASRGAETPGDNCRGGRVRYGVMPCLGSTWGQHYLAQLKEFLTNTGFAMLEHDGSYPGDTCAATDHPGHRDLTDSQWAQHRAIADFYQWCRGEGVFLNIPDWYFLNGGSKCGMGYREDNWSLPRAEQEIIERQNVYDGTWDKTGSMGWMQVPLVQYHGGGAAATIEPLHEHLDHYEARLANLLGAGVQACYRGVRIYDTDETKAVVKRWIDFYKAHREVLDADFIHLRRPDGRDWDGLVHVNPQGQEKALAFFYNPLSESIERDIRVPLRYAGLSGRAKISWQGEADKAVELAADQSVGLHVKIPPRGRTWAVFRSLEN